MICELFLELIEGISLVVLLEIVLQGFPVTHGRHGSNGQWAASLVGPWTLSLSVTLGIYSCLHYSYRPRLIY